MKSLSYWAVVHPITSWVLLAITQIILGVLVFEWGILQAMSGIALPPVLIYLGMVLCILATVFYPVRRSASPFWKWSYGRQKLMDFTLLFSGLLMMCTWANREVFRLDRTAENETVVFVALAEQPIPEKSISFWQDVVRSGPRQALQNVLTKQVTLRVQKIKASENERRSVWWIVLLIILGCLLSVVIGCALACNGMGAWGALVIFGGILFFIIGGTSWYKSRRMANAKLKGPSLEGEKLG